jgi:hypothetical protein
MRPGLAVALLFLFSTSARAAGPVLFYVEPESGGACAWKLFDADRRATRTARSTSACPTQIVWDPARKRVVFAMAGALYDADWPGAAPPRLLGPERPEADEWWVDRDSGRVRAGWTVMPYDPNSSEERDAVVHERGRTTFVSFEGHELPLGALPPMVRNGIYGAHELGVVGVDELRDGSWARLAVKATKLGFPTMTYCDDVGCRPEEVLRARERWQGEQFYGLGTLRRPLSDARDPRAVSCVGECREVLALGRGFALVLGHVTQHDHPNLVGPAAVCRVRPRGPLPHDLDDVKDACTESRALPVTSDYLATSLGQGFALVVGLDLERRSVGDHPIVVAPGELEPLVDAPTGRLARWLAPELAR